MSRSSTHYTNEAYLAATAEIPECFEVKPVYISIFEEAIFQKAKQRQAARS
jgi:hypothetical protein